MNKIKNVTKRPNQRGKPEIIIEGEDWPNEKFLHRLSVNQAFKLVERLHKILGGEYSG